ncbi:MAG: hypothetical protein IPP90_12055 [Gemmatimonadaceae bacterium]|nr:hypothetical protein [Gemmatimonadaceae bacterium]
MTPPRSLAGRAEADLAYVRDVLDRTHRFSAVPGLGGVLMGSSALIAAVVAEGQPTPERWLQVWLIESVLAIGIGATTLVRKARRAGLPLSASPARRFALGLMPPVLVGALLSFGALRANAGALLPPIWLCCYGIGVLGAGVVSSVAAVPIMGAVFVVLGALAMATPTAWSNIWLALGFGVSHIIVGALVLRRHGG